MVELTKSALLGLFKYSGAMGIQERITHWSGRTFLPILLFHRVTDAIPPDGLTVTTEWFRQFCGMLQKRFHVVSLSEAMQLLESGERWPRRVTAITFDDCYRDNLLAARVLAEHKLPACFFIPTAYPGTDYVFPWDSSLTRMANLTWDEIREMASMGHEIGSHTAHHVDMAQVPLEEVRRELVESKLELEKQLQRPVHWLAYPYGGRDNFRQERLGLVLEAGYKACFSGYGGFLRPGMKGEIIPRTATPYFRSLLKLEMYMAGCMNWFLALKRPWGAKNVHKSYALSVNGGSASLLAASRNRGSTGPRVGKKRGSC